MVDTRAEANAGLVELPDVAIGVLEVGGADSPTSILRRAEELRAARPPIGHSVPSPDRVI